MSRKVVLVTGASSGIGAAVALRFATLGCSVALHFNSNREGAERVVSEAGDPQRLELFGGDLCRPGVAAQIVDEVIARFGQIDVVVNNVGGAIERRDLASVDNDFYDALLDLNVRSMVFMTQATLAHMRSRRSGSIINVGSTAARGAGSPGQALYSGVKGFIASFTIKLAKELGPDGVRVNAIAPGAVLTPALLRAVTPSQLEQIASMVPLGRVAEPGDCTGPILFLATDSLSSFVTGQIVEITGGL